jgi:hypothetical protein
MGYIFLRRRGHALERIEQIKLAAHGAELEEHTRRNHHATAAPDAALDDIAGDLVSDDVSHGLCQGVDPLRRCHRVGPHKVHELAVFNGEIFWDGILRETILGLGDSILGLGRTSPDDLVAK